MCRFIESIRFEKGQYQLLEYHQKRVNSTFQQFFPDTSPLKLRDVLPDLSHGESHKVRVVYGRKVYNISQAPYQMAPIASFQLVRADTVSYNFKFHDRSQMDRLKEASRADEIIMVKNGLLTDASYANLAFFDGSRWFTPDTFLLNGVQRQYLIDTGQITEKPIRPEDLQHFEKFCLINAMLQLEELMFTMDAISH